MSKFLYNSKILDNIAMGVKDNVSLHIYEGAIRSSKTASAIQEFFEAVQDSDEELHCIAATDLDAIRENILDCEVGLRKLYPNYCNLVKDKIGGYYLEIKCDIANKPTLKRVLLVGYSDASKWEKILGKTLGVILIDEVNIANKRFVDECFSRQASVNKPLMIWTLNGDVPSHPIYTEYINRAKPIGRVPLSILTEMSKCEKQKGWYYTHWTMWDNPIMTPDKIERTTSIYPIGSYYYKIKILGERGTPARLIYNEYMSEEKHIRSLVVGDRVKIFPKYTIGVDIGGNGATNSISLIGFENDFSQICVVDKVQFKQCGYDEKKQLILQTILTWKALNIPIECVAVDSAESNFIRDLKMAFMPYGVEVIGSYKATIKERIDLGVILLSTGRLYFNDNQGGRDAYSCFLQACWTEGKEGIERQDLNLPLNDAIDSIEYALTIHMKEITLATYRGVR